MDWRNYVLYWNNEAMQIDFAEDYELAVKVAKHLATQGIESYLSHMDQDGDEKSYETFGEPETLKDQYERIRNK